MCTKIVESAGGFDAEHAALATISVPHFPSWMLEHSERGTREASVQLASGDVIDDFEILRTLGRGSAGIVYLAYQRSLGRRVALKVMPRVGQEARTMALLEHPHIVQVFSESIDPVRDHRLLCMQYVAGANLSDVIARLKQLPREQLCGAALVAVLDELSDGPPAIDIVASRGRERLMAADYVQAVCWIGSMLAEALHFAHSRGVLHRDVKPANILLDAGGRPLLADFSLALAARNDDPSHEHLFGGTLPYMSPEHLDAFNPDSTTNEQAVDERSDLYSLGVVLYELLALRLPPTSAPPETGVSALAARARARRATPPRLDWSFPDVSATLACTVRRCLEGDPKRRFPSVARLAKALEGCRLLQEWRRQTQPTRALKTIAHAPIAASISLAVLPHLLGSLFMTAYTALIVFPDLTETQQRGLLWTVAVCIGTTFPLFVSVAVLRHLRAAWRIGRASEQMLRGAAGVGTARGRLLRLPIEASCLSLIGWLSPLVVIPLGMRLLEADLTWRHGTHLAVAVLLAFLIAATYSFMLMELVIVRHWYPRAWFSAAQFGDRARTELAPACSRARFFPLAAGCVPLVALFMTVSLGRESFHTGGQFEYRLLMSSFILLGLAGIPLANMIGGAITQAFHALPRP